MEYYFGDQLRWSFGFENPNKAGALIASLLPFLWIAWDWSWSRVQGGRGRASAVAWVGVVMAGGALWAGWWLLFQTLSRGALVAAVMAFLYLAWGCWRRRFPVQMGKRRRTAAFVLILLIGWAALPGGMLERAESSRGDPSVGNRLALWQEGLRMLADHPGGVGAGRSGEVYMQWYQPLEATSGYRTLVNSYLTFAVERGVGPFGLALFGAFLLWGWSSSGADDGWSLGLRAVLLAFAVAGVFSTTMEEGWIWIPPTVAAVLLGRIALARRNPLRWGSAAAGALLTVGLMLGAGWTLGRDAEVRVRMTQGPSGPMRVQLLRAGGADGEEEALLVLPDRRVMGERYGKLIRRLVLASGRSALVLEAWEEERRFPGRAKLALVAGRAVRVIPRVSAERIVLLAPAMPEEEDVDPAALGGGTGEVSLLVAGFDEDGRGRWWREAFARTGREGLVVTLAGVGTRLDWAWDEVIGALPMGAESGP